MKTKSLLYLFSASVLMASCGEKDKESPSGVIEWQSATGGSEGDLANAVVQGKNGEYLVVGVAYSYYGKNTGDITGSRGGFSDAIITKIDASGNKQWVKVFGGSSVDEARAVAATPDGDFIVAGFSGSNDGDIPKKLGYDDFWIMKIDTDGKIKWSKTYGSTSEDQAHAVVVTPDGGCVVTGFTEGNNVDVVGNNNNKQNVWILKLDADGNKQWAKMYGGSQDERALSIAACQDGGYAITGFAYSTDGDVTGHHGYSNTDIWVLKVDGNGNKQWDKCYGGEASDYAQSIKTTSDGGFVVAGSTVSIDGDFTDPLRTSSGTNYSDACVLKLDITGNKQWAKAYGGSSSESANAIVPSADGGYVFSGSTASSDGNVSGYPAGGKETDYWLVKLDGNGNLKWNNCYGSTGSDVSSSLIRTNDNGYILTGSIKQGDRDVNVQTYGQYDWWTLKIKSL
jgi:hypothetical protein